MSTFTSKRFVASAVVTAVVLFATPAFATGPTTISGWGTEAAGLVTDNMGPIALALIALATATIVLAVGQNLLGRAYAAVSSLGSKKPVRGK